jgi:monoamine oxidase
MSRSFYATLRRLNGNVPDEAAVLDTLGTRRDHLHRVALLPDGLSRTDLDGCTAVAGSSVAVIGAGFAGLAAAWYLSQAGASVTVFEAADHAGGRVLTDRALITGKYAEAGAELIGENHPLWWELSSMFGLQLVPVTTPEDYESRGLEVRLRLGDHDLTPDERTQVDADLLPVVDAIGQDAKDVDPDQPWTHPNAAAFDSLSVSDRLDQLLGAGSSLARQVIEFTIANDNCALVTQQSYLGLLTLVSAGRTGDDPAGLRGYWESTETHRCGGGNDQLAVQLAGTLTNVQLSSPVDTISVSAGNIGLDVSGTAGGSYTFDYAVLTASPFSWPSVQADPPWNWNPADWTMSHGPAVKYISAVDTKFWEADGLAPSALWDGIGSVWEGTDNQPDADGGFALSTYSGGPYVLDGTQYPGQLSQLYPSIATFATRFADWPNTQYVGTGYSVPALGEVTTIAQTLAGPFGDRLFFAGEQACPGFFGYMEGALLSGVTAARRIVQVLCPGAVPQPVTT